MNRILLASVLFAVVGCNEDRAQNSPVVAEPSHRQAQAARPPLAPFPPPLVGIIPGGNFIGIRDTFSYFPGPVWVYADAGNPSDKFISYESLSPTPAGAIFLGQYPNVGSALATHWQAERHLTGLRMAQNH